MWIEARKFFFNTWHHFHHNKDTNPVISMSLLLSKSIHKGGIKWMERQGLELNMVSILRKTSQNLLEERKTGFFVGVTEWDPK